MTFDLDGAERVKIQVIETNFGIIMGFYLPDGLAVPQRVKFDNRSLQHIVHVPGRIIQLFDETLRALNWKEGDELRWNVYSDRVDFFK